MRTRNPHVYLNVHRPWWRRRWRAVTYGYAGEVRRCWTKGGAERWLRTREQQ